MDDRITHLGSRTILLGKTPNNTVLEARYGWLGSQVALKDIFEQGIILQMGNVIGVPITQHQHKNTLFELVLSAIGNKFRVAIIGQ